MKEMFARLRVSSNIVYIRLRITYLHSFVLQGDHGGPYC